MTKLKNRKQILFYGGAMWFGVIAWLSCIPELAYVQDSVQALWYTAGFIIIPVALVGTITFILAWKQLPWREDETGT